jgi:undecaprenyl diphosphate synthase
MTPKLLPTHLGFIIDGTRRWAEKRGLSPQEGHSAGYHTLKTVLLDVIGRGVEYASVYVFSTENWRRGTKEVNHLMMLLLRILRDDAPIFVAHNVRVRVIGSRSRFSEKILAAIDDIEELTAPLDGGQLLVCVNYGGQQEIVDALEGMMSNGVGSGQVDAKKIEQYLYAPDVPPCDMIVRTGGEQRLSNFMLWRSAYSELMFIKKYWPEMTKRDVTRILKEYESRVRRFGG